MVLSSKFNKEVWDGGLLVSILHIYMDYGWYGFGRHGKSE